MKRIPSQTALTFALLIGSVPGIWLGAQLTRKMPEKVVRGLLCAALAIDRRHNGYILHKRDPSALQAAEPAAQRPPGEAKTESSLDSCLWLAPGEPVAEDAVARGPRIGVRPGRPLSPPPRPAGARRRARPPCQPA